MILVLAVDIGSAIWNLISRNKGSLQTLLSVRENWVKCFFSIGTIVQGYFNFNNQTLNFCHLRKDTCHIWVWCDPDWDWSGGSDHKGWDTYQFNLWVSIHISELYIPIQKTCLFWLCSWNWVSKPATDNRHVFSEPGATETKSKDKSICLHFLKIIPCMTLLPSLFS